MRKKLVLSLILIACFSWHLNSDTLDCQRSFEIGENAARVEHRAWGWYLIGIGAGMLGAGAIFAVVYSVPDGVATLGSVLTLTAPFVPAFSCSQGVTRFIRISAV